MDLYGFDGVDEKVLKKERARARDLRKSRWWQNQLARGECYYCKAKFPPADLTMDHVVPLMRGGRSTKDNIVCCCKECNNRKKNMLPMEWQEYIEHL